MKRSFLIILSLLLASSAFSQKTTVYQLKFTNVEDGFGFQNNLKRDVFIHLSRPSGQTYKFRLTDYNAVLYTPVLKVTAKRFKSVVSDQLKPYLAMANLDRDSDFTSQLSSMPTIDKETPKSIENDQSAVDSLEARIRDNHMRIRKIDQSLQNKLNSNERRDLTAQRTKIATETIQLKSQKAALESQIARMASILQTIANFSAASRRVIDVEKIFTDLMKSLKDSKESITRCKDLRDAVSAEVMEIMGLPPASEISAFEEQFNLALHTCTALKESLALQLGSGTAVSDESTLAAVDKAFIVSEAVEARKATLTEMVESFTRLFPKKEAAESVPYKHKYDYALVDIKLVNNLNPKDTVLKQQVKILTKGGVDIDFAIGMAYDNIFKRSWYVDTVGTGSIREERVTKLDFTWAALINISARVGPNGRAGISFGPGISLVDGDPRYLFGLHYFCGRRDLIGLSAGLCIGKKNFLPSVVSKDGKTPNDNLPEALTSVTPYTKHATGFYAGLFYNFSRQ